MQKELATEKVKRETGLEHVLASLNILTPYGRKALQGITPFLPGEEEDLREVFRRVSPCVRSWVRMLPAPGN